jgi:hypothetical protein
MPKQGVNPERDNIARFQPTCIACPLVLASTKNIANERQSLRIAAPLAGPCKVGFAYSGETKHKAN